MSEFDEDQDPTAALKASEERFQLATEGADAGVWDHDLATLKFTWSERHYAMFGAPPGTPASFELWRSLVHPEDLPAALAEFARAKRERTPFRALYRINRRGETRWIEDAGRYFYDDAGAAIRCAGVVLDVTERKAAAAALQESETRLKLIQAAGAIGTIDWEVQTGRIFRSPEYCALQGLPPDTPTDGVYTDQWMDRLHPDDKESVLAKFRADLARGGPFSLEYRIVRPDTGQIRWLHNRGAVLHDERGRPVRLLSAQTDITDRKRAELALRESEARFREAADSSPAPMWMTNAEGKIEFVNSRFQEFAGLSAEALSGDAWIALLHADDLRSVVDARARAWAEGRRAYEFEARFRNADGTWRWMDVSSRPRRDPKGGFHGYVGLAIDRTAARAAEALLRDSEARYRSLLARMDQAFCALDLIDDPASGRAIDFRIVETNPAFERHADLVDAVGKTASELAPLIGREWIEFMDHAARSDAPARFDRISSATGRAYEGEAVRIGSPGARKVAVFFRDVSERRRAEEQIRLLMREVNHRSKNMLAVVLAVANQMAADEQPALFVDRLRDRLQALAAGHDLLVENNWRYIEMSELARVQLAHLGDLADSRIALEGPCVRLAPAAAQTLGMALHELATNAAKYGALGDERGRVAVSWTINGPAGAPVFSITWQESGAGPVTPPVRKGFGSTVLTRMVEMSLGATVRLDYRREGLVWECAAPSAAVIESKLRADLN